LFDMKKVLGLFLLTTTMTLGAAACTGQIAVGDTREDGGGGGGNDSIGNGGAPHDGGAGSVISRGPDASTGSSPCGPNEFWDGGCLPCFAADAGPAGCAQAQVIDGACYETMCDDNSGWCACLVDDVVQSQTYGLGSNACQPGGEWARCGFPTASSNHGCGANEFWDGGCLPCFAGDAGPSGCDDVQLLGGHCYDVMCDDSNGWCACIVDDVVLQQTYVEAGTNLCASPSQDWARCGFPSADASVGD
jgi:hypothetical protein